LKWTSCPFAGDSGDGLNLAKALSECVFLLTQRLDELDS